MSTKTRKPAKPATRRFFVSFQDDPDLMDFCDPETFGHIEADSLDSAAEEFESAESLEGSGSNLHEYAIELAFSVENRDYVTFYVIEHDGENVIDGPAEFRCAFEIEARLRRPQRTVSP